MKYLIKKDKYNSKRGGYSRIVAVYCKICGNKIAEYQKDGSGSLKRMYLDRIVAPKEMTGLQEKEFRELGALVCRGCNELLAIPYVYKYEKRKAYKIFQDCVFVKIIKNQD